MRSADEQPKRLADVLVPGALPPKKDDPVGDLADRLEGLSGRAFSRALVSSPEYRRSLVRRAMADALAPAVECRLLDHAWGAPVKRLEVTNPDRPFKDATFEELVRRQAVLDRYIRMFSDARRTNDEVNRSPAEDPPESETPPSVH